MAYCIYQDVYVPDAFGRRQCTIKEVPVPNQGAMFIILAGSNKEVVVAGWRGAYIRHTTYHAHSRYGWEELFPGHPD